MTNYLAGLGCAQGHHLLVEAAEVSESGFASS
jgi:hypothetical protein